jgi:hypothetical protein
MAMWGSTQFAGASLPDPEHAATIARHRAMVPR